MSRVVCWGHLPHRPSLGQCRTPPPHSCCLAVIYDFLVLVFSSRRGATRHALTILRGKRLDIEVEHPPVRYGHVWNTCARK
ncbi:hypothetical protein TNCV_1134171 [Trichonephila clavipes]|nr:hypothetical protein TNCV_1134171 [Trichonephila clavipes]